MSWILGLGCSGADPDIVPVRGKVVFTARDRPEICRLTFVPLADRTGGKRAAGGEMQSDGTYRVTPFRGATGLYPGSYRVRASYYDLKPGGDRNRESDWRRTDFEVAEPLEVSSSQSAINYDIEITGP